MTTVVDNSNVENLNAQNPGTQGPSDRDVPSLPVLQIRQDFPILETKIHERPLIYFDNAATTQKPQCVIDAIHDFYTQHNANVHRGLHTLSERATAMMESARAKIARFIQAPGPENIVFTKGTTDGFNLLASSLSQLMPKIGNEIIITHMEHHANIVPWQLMCERVGAQLKVVNINDRGELDLDHLESLLSSKTAAVSFTAISNSLGTVNPCQQIIERVRQHPQCQDRPVAIIVDGAQAVAHQAVNVTELDCDFLLFSAHKLFGPTGVGALYGKSEWLNRLPPYQGGGDMIRVVRFEGSTFAEPPQKFEAGTPAIAQCIGFGQAVDYISQFDTRAIAAHETRLLNRLETGLQEQSGIRIIGQAQHKAGLVSFVCDDIHSHDLGTLLDFEGVAIRVGHHCSMPVMDYFKVPATARASICLYNTEDEVDAFCQALARVRAAFK